MDLHRVHNVFHISQLRKYVPDKSHVLQPETIELDQILSFKERPVKVLDCQVVVHELRVLILWKFCGLMKFCGPGKLRTIWERIIPSYFPRVVELRGRNSFLLRGVECGRISRFYLIFPHSVLNLVPSMDIALHIVMLNYLKSTTTKTFCKENALKSQNSLKFSFKIVISVPKFRDETSFKEGRL